MRDTIITTELLSPEGVGHITIERAMSNDAEALMNVQNLAFHEDELAYDDCPSPIKDPQTMVSKIQDAIFYKFTCDGAIVGGIEIYKRSDDRCHIYMLCVHPDYQDRGVGTQALRYVLTAHPEVSVWTLVTPSENSRSRHLYEKMGFVAVDAWVHSPKLTLVRYRLVVERSAPVRALPT